MNSASHSHDKPSFDATEFRTSHGELTDSVADLYSRLRQRSIPERRHNRYSLPINAYSYSEFPHTLRDHVVVEEVNSLTMDFIYDYEEERDTFIQTTSIEIEDSQGHTIVISDGEWQGTKYFYNPYLLEKEIEEPQKLLPCPSTDVARLLLYGLGQPEEMVQKGDFSEIDLLDPERTDVLESGVEIYGIKQFRSDSYTVEGIAQVVVTDENVTDGGPRFITQLATPIVINYTFRPGAS